MTRLRVATIGAGYFSQFHYDAWGRLPVDVVGVCDLDAGRATAIAAGFPGARAFADATQMLEQTSPELLDVIVPPAAQEPVVRAALARRVPVICQKPFTPSLEGEHGVARLDGDGAVWRRAHGANDEQRVEFPCSEQGFAGDSVLATQRHVIDHMLHGTPLANSAADYLDNMRVVEAIYRSAETGTWVTP